MWDRGGTYSDDVRNGVRKPQRAKNEPHLAALAHCTQAHCAKGLERWVTTAGECAERRQEYEERLRGGWGDRDEGIGRRVRKERDSCDALIEADGGGKVGR